MPSWQMCKVAPYQINVCKMGGRHSFCKWQINYRNPIKMMFLHLRDHILFTIWPSSNSLLWWRPLSTFCSLQTAHISSSEKNLCELNVPASGNISQRASKVSHKKVGRLSALFSNIAKQFDHNTFKWNSIYCTYCIIEVIRLHESIFRSQNIFWNVPNWQKYWNFS